jgi:hypothetical protein
VDDGGEAVAGVAFDAFPHLDDRAAGGIDEDALAGLEAGHFLDRDAEGRDDDDVVGAYVVEREALARLGTGEEANVHLAQASIDARIVDDFVGEEDAAVGKLAPGLVGEVHRLVDAVAESELGGQTEAERSDFQRPAVFADTLDQGTVVVGVEFVGDFAFQSQAGTVIAIGSGRRVGVVGTVGHGGGSWVGSRRGGRGGSGPLDSGSGFGGQSTHARQSVGREFQHHLGVFGFPLDLRNAAEQEGLFVKHSSLASHPSEAVERRDGQSLGGDDGAQPLDGSFADVGHDLRRRLGSPEQLEPLGDQEDRDPDEVVEDGVEMQLGGAGGGVAPRRGQPVERDRGQGLAEMRAYPEGFSGSDHSLRSRHGVVPIPIRAMRIGRHMGRRFVQDGDLGTFGFAIDREGLTREHRDQCRVGFAVLADGEKRDHQVGVLAFLGPGGTSHFEVLPQKDAVSRASHGAGPFEVPGADNGREHAGREGGEVGVGGPSRRRKVGGRRRGGRGFGGNRGFGGVNGGGGCQVGNRVCSRHGGVQIEIEIVQFRPLRLRRRGGVRDGRWGCFLPASRLEVVDRRRTIDDIEIQVVVLVAFSPGGDRQRGLLASGITPGSFRNALRRRRGAGTARDHG